MVFGFSSCYACLLRNHHPGGEWRVIEAVGVGDSSYYYSYSTPNSLAQDQFDIPNRHPSSLKVLSASSMSEHLLNKEEDKPRM